MREDEGAQAVILGVAVMVIRYVVTMALFPERRWLGSGTIPISSPPTLTTIISSWADKSVHCRRAGR